MESLENTPNNHEQTHVSPENEEELAPEEMRRILENDPMAQCKFIKSDVDIESIPCVVDKDMLTQRGYSEKAIETIEKMAENVVEYLPRPIIQDSFGEDHVARKKWRESLDPKMRDFYKSNKCRNNSTNFLGSIQLIESMAETKNDTELLEKLRNIQNEIYNYKDQENPTDDEKNRMYNNFKHFGEQDMEEKKKIIKKLDHIALESLKTICKEVEKPEQEN